MNPLNLVKWASVCNRQGDSCAVKGLPGLQSNTHSMRSGYTLHCMLEIHVLYYSLLIWCLNVEVNWLVLMGCGPLWWMAGMSLRRGQWSTAAVWYYQQMWELCLRFSRSFWSRWDMFKGLQSANVCLGPVKQMQSRWLDYESKMQLRWNILNLHSYVGLIP